MRAFLKGFTYAAKGVARAVWEERNLRFHLCVAAYVVVFSFFYKLSTLEYTLLTLVIVGVLALELVNTCIERIVDELCPQQNKLAGRIKDIAAGAVLVFCIGAVCCGVLLFWDLAIFADIFSWFSGRPLVIVLLILSLILSVYFVFFFPPKRARHSDETPHSKSK